MKASKKTIETLFMVLSLGGITLMVASLVWAIITGQVDINLL